MQGSASYFFVSIIRTGKAQTSLWLRGCTTPRVTALKTVPPVETPPCGLFYENICYGSIFLSWWSKGIRGRKWRTMIKGFDPRYLTHGIWPTVFDPKYLTLLKYNGTMFPSHLGQWNITKGGNPYASGSLEKYHRHYVYSWRDNVPPSND